MPTTSSFRARSKHPRSGRIGEWKDTLGERQLSRIELLLHEQGISLDEFVLE